MYEDANKQITEVKSLHVVINVKSNLISSQLLHQTAM